MKYLVIVCSVFFSFISLVSCMSAHKANYSQQTGDSKDRDLVVSVEQNSRMSTNNFVVLEYTLENKGSDFKRFDSITIDLDPKMKDQVQIVVGQDLVSWSEGIKNKIQLDNYNYQTFMAGVTALAATAAVMSDDPQFQQASLGVTAAGAGILAIDDFARIQEQVRDVTKSDSRGLIPQSHVLSSPVSLPPNLFLKRFAVFYVKSAAKDQFHKMTLNLSAQGKKTSFVAKFKDPAKAVSTLAACGKSDVQLAEPMFFRGYKIHCENNCLLLHEFNRKSCRRNFQSFLNRSNN